MTQDNAIKKIEKAKDLLEDIYYILDEVHYDYVIPALETKSGEINEELHNDVINSLLTAKFDIYEMKDFIETIPLDKVGY